MCLQPAVEAQQVIVVTLKNTQMWKHKQVSNKKNKKK